MRSKHWQPPAPLYPAFAQRSTLILSASAAITVFTLAAFALRLLLLDVFPLREDEAIYSFWASMVWRDPWFLQVWPDKPPVFLWLQAATLSVFGPSAAAARLLSIAASTLTVPVAAVIAGRLWGDRAAIAAAALLTLNPFAISFGPTAYTDSLLVLFGMTALCCALMGRPGWAGVWLGAAIMTKQQGALYAPLVLGCVVLWPSGGNDDPLPRSSLRSRLVALSLGAAGVAAVTLPILAWDAARWATAPSPWDMGVRNYGPLTLVPPTHWGQRVSAWGDVVWHLTASWPVWALMAMFLSWQVFSGIQLRLSPGKLIGLWACVFFSAHVIFSAPPWDRYLLPIAPVVALAGARLVAEHLNLSGWRRAAVIFLAALLLIPPALEASQGELPIGADHGDLTGLDEALLWTANSAPGDKALYHRVVGWQARFYLFDQVQSGAVELRWFPSAVYLADNAAKTPHLRRFVVEPDWATTDDVAFHLTTRGLRLHKEAQMGRFTVYEITQPPRPLCAWCASRVPGGWPWIAAPAPWSVAQP